MPDIDINTMNDSKSDIGSDESQLIDINHYRNLVRTYIDMRRYKTALFWAEKVVTLSNYEPKDVYWQAQCMFLLKEYHRAAHILKLRGLEKTNLFCHYLTVESLLEAKEYTDAIELLNSVDIENMSSTILLDQTTNFSADQTLNYADPTKAEILSSIWLLKGKVLEAMDNRTLAMDSYIQALQFSVYCTEALDALVQHEMLFAWEEKEIIENLPFSQQCTDADTKIIKNLYGSKLKKYFQSIVQDQINNPEQTPLFNLPSIKSIRENTESINKTDREEVKFGRRSTKLFTPANRNILSPATKILNDLKATPTYSIQNSLSRHSFSPQDSIKDYSERKKETTVACKTAIPLSLASKRIHNSVDMMVTKAEKMFYNCEYKKCMQILDETFKEDPFHANGLTVLIGCLVELKEFNKLFYIAHKLVDLYPDQACSWYAVGCYYDIIGKSDPARRYLSKATTLNRLFGPAWLAYGHSFAKENEHDQAMAAYFKATQLMRGCHLPLLYIGVECGLTKNLELAEKFFYQAMSIAPLDVSVLHELGVIKYEYEKYTDAEELLRTTLDMVTKMAKQNRESISERWEPLLNNLGHCCRKNKKYAEALAFHQQALVLKPQTATTYTAIGFVQALLGKLENAVESLHRSLAIKRDDIVTSALLKYCIEDLMEENSLPDNISDTLPETPAMRGDITSSPTSTEIPITKLRLKYDDSNASRSSDASFDMSMDI